MHVNVFASRAKQSIPWRLRRELSRTIASGYYPRNDYFLLSFTYVVILLFMNTHALAYLKKGLVYFSTPTVVMGPWAGKTMVSSGKEKICLRICSI